MYQSKVFVAMVLMLVRTMRTMSFVRSRRGTDYRFPKQIFAEVIGLYGLIVALILNTRASEGVC